MFEAARAGRIGYLAPLSSLNFASQPKKKSFPELLTLPNERAESFLPEPWDPHAALEIMPTIRNISVISHDGLRSSQAEETGEPKARKACSRCLS